MNVQLRWFFAFLFFCQIVSAQTKIYTTRRVNPHPPVIDGKLNDAGWDLVSWDGDFTQFEPDNGEAPCQPTNFKILYDDKNVYVGIRAHDTEPKKIACRLSRKDEPDGDMVAVQFDSYHDHQTAFTFVVNAAGVKMDGIWTNDGDNEDFSPDPVWYVKTAVDEKGWTAEMRIPLSQLRFGNMEHQVWGLQVLRHLYRNEELSLWQPIAKDAPGWVHLFGELHGLEGILPSRRIELLPYGVGSTETMEKEEGNPFVPGRDYGWDIGLDGKIGVTSDLTMDFTINPDFGQVEADPSVVNLTAFETFFQEKRPFFIEGKNILDYQLLGGNNDFSNDNLFYSRRIGRPASHSPDLEDDEYAKMPTNTSILGAMKVTGKTRSGLSIGIMEAVTAKEQAEIDFAGTRRFETVEPMTNYFLTRLQKDYREGGTRIGAMMTSTYRNIREEHLKFLNRSAITGGVDFAHEWKDRTYSLSFTSVFSRIQGTEEAILEAQTSSRRYFQRPDADHVHVDSSRTSLSGYGGTLEFSKSGNGNIRYAVVATWRSPGLELNDMGFLREGDRIFQFVWCQYRVLAPFSIFREFNVNVNQWAGWNFGGENYVKGGNIGFDMQFTNYWSFGSGIYRAMDGLSSSRLRGGPQLVSPGRWYSWFYMNTDSKKMLQLSLNGSMDSYDDGVSRSFSINSGFTLRPNDAFSLSVYPFYSYNKSDLQYIDTLDFEDEDRYVFGRIDQTTTGVVIRFNYAITPTFSIQFYGQPFVSAGAYSHFKRITNPRADAYEDRFQLYTDDDLSYDADDEAYLIDENIDGSEDYRFDLPDFNFRQFRSNLVIRWEYTPGSTLYLVWSQERTGSEAIGDFSYTRDMKDLFDVYPHDVFLIKFSKWFSL